MIIWILNFFKLPNTDCSLANEEESVDASLGVLGAECAVATKDLQTENLMAALLNLQTGSNCMNPHLDFSLISLCQSELCPD